MKKYEGKEDTPIRTLFLQNHAPDEDLVRLSWIDITFNDSDLTVEQAIDQEPVLMETVGYLLADTDSKVIIASTMMEDGYRAVICVPKGCVVNVEKLCRSKQQIWEADKVSIKKKKAKGRNN